MESLWREALIETIRPILEDASEEVGADLSGTEDRLVEALLPILLATGGQR